MQSPDVELTFNVSGIESLPMSYIEDDDDEDEQAPPTESSDVEAAVTPAEEEEEEEDDDDDEKAAVHDRSEIRFYRLALASNIWFLIASVMYLWLGVITFQYFDALKTVPIWLLAVDDDYAWIGYIEDDYVFQAGKKGTWISRYTIVYSIAAVGFVITGILDFIKYPGCTGILFILAGGFGLASAMCTDVNEYLSVVFNSVSVHLFMIEAIGLLFRRSFFGGLETWLRISDSFFLIGSLIDVASSYAAIFDVFNVQLAVLDIVAACLWVLTSLIYIGTTYYIQHHAGFEAAMHKGEMFVDNTQVEPESDRQEAGEAAEVDGDCM